MSKVFDLVLGVFREPGLVAELREKQLPDDLGLVIRLAAGEDAALQGAVDATGEAPETLLEASVFFLQQVLFAPGADSYRVLGASADWAQDRLRENYRWLMKWLHPDRNQDGWEAVYADRVNVAWQDLKTPDRRADYDRRVPSAAASLPAVGTSLVRRPAPAGRVASGPLLSGSAVRRLPALVLGSLGVLAAATIGLMYWAQSETYRELSERRRDRGDPPVDDAPGLATPAGDVAISQVQAPAAVAIDPVPVDMASQVVVPEAAGRDAAAGDVTSALPAEPVAAAPDASLAAAVAAIVAVDGAPTTAAPSDPVPDLPEPVASVTVAPAPEPVEPESSPVAETASMAVGGPDAVPAAATAKADTVPTLAVPVATAVAAPKPALPNPTLAAAPAPADPGVASGPASPPKASSGSPPPPIPESPRKRPATSAVGAEAVAESRPPEPVRPPTKGSAAPPPPVPVPAAAEPIAGSPRAVPAPAVAAESKPAGRDVQPGGARVDPVAVAATAAGRPGAPVAPPDGKLLVADTPVTAAKPVAAPTVAVEQPPAAPAAPVRSDAEALVREFASAYAAGDLARFDRLLASGMRQAPAMDSMRSRFVSTEMRYLELEQLRWHPEAGQGQVRAKFRDTYVPRGGRKAITESGDIEWTIRIDAGDARIASMARSDAES